MRIINGPERRGPERPGPDYPAEWDAELRWHPCPDCGCQCSSAEWACWRCGAVQDEDAPVWETCPRCEGERSVRDAYDLDVACPECDGQGGRER